MKWYKKFNPSVMVHLSNGRGIKFDTLDNILGFYATDNPGIISEFETCMREQRGGVMEISQEDFDEQYGSKKKLSPNFRPKPLNREEIAASMPLDTQLAPTPQRQAGAARVDVAVSGSDIKRVPEPEAPAAAPATEQPAAPPPPPRTGKVADLKKSKTT